MGKKAKAFVHCCAALIVLSFAGAAQASVAISSSPTKNMNCSAGVCAPTAKDAVLNVTDLTNMLATEDVKIVTGAGAVTITTFSPFSWTSAHRLTLDAYYNVTFRARVTVARKGGISIVTNDGGTGGDLIFFRGAKLNLDPALSKLAINGHAFRLSTTLDDLATAIDRKPSGYFALVRDLDAATHKDYRSSPIQRPLVGQFQGLGHTIANLAIADPVGACVGLFRAIAEGGYAANIHLANVRMTSTLPHYGRLGAVAGCSKGTVANSFATGMLTGIWVGGLVGYNDGTVVNSGTGTIVTGKIAGGVVAISDGTISRCRAFGPVSGFFLARRAHFRVYIGGIAGKATRIDRSYATGDVSLGTARPSGPHFPGIGGIAGHVSGMITDSYATGMVQAGNVSLVGGIVGWGHHGEINSVYVIGRINGSSKPVASTGAVVGLAGSNIHFDNAYWDFESTKQSKGCGDGDCAGVVALTDRELRAGLPIGFDPAVWGHKKGINKGYPYLLANPPQ